MPHDKFRHSGFHRIGDRYATFFDPDRFLGRNPFDDNWIAPHDLVIKNGNRQYEIQVLLPGYKKSEIQVDIQDHRLTIRATTNRIEKKYSKFVEGPVLYERKRSFQLGPEIDKDHITAKFENGMLTILLPRHNKDETWEQRKKKVAVT